MLFSRLTNKEGRMIVSILRRTPSPRPNEEGLLGRRGGGDSGGSTFGSACVLVAGMAAVIGTVALMLYLSSSAPCPSGEKLVVSDKLNTCICALANSTLSICPG